MKEAFSYQSFPSKRSKSAKEEAMPLFVPGGTQQWIMESNLLSLRLIVVLQLLLMSAKKLKAGEVSIDASHRPTTECRSTSDMQIFVLVGIACLDLSLTPARERNE
jgi:hypothetical protein